MNDFPDLLPPPARNLTPEQRDRLRARLADVRTEERARRWVLPGLSAAVVLACVGGAVAVSNSLGDDPQQRQAQPAASGLPDPLSFVDDGGGVCLERAPRTTVFYNTVTTSREVVLAGVSLKDSSGATIAGSWVAQVDPNGVAASGGFDEGRHGIRPSVGWQHRYPLESARLVPGKAYRVFYRVTFAAGSEFHGATFSYLDAGAPNSSTITGTVRAREAC